MKALVDTNFLLYCIKEKIQLFDFFQDFSEILIPRGVIDELVRIAQEGGPREKTRAEIALKLVAVSRVTILPLSGYVDQQILEYAFTHKGIVVATLDQKLRRALQKKTKVLVVKGRKKFEVL